MTGLSAVIAITGVIGVVWDVIVRLRDAERALNNVEMIRMQDKAEAERALGKVEAEAERALGKVEMARIEDKAELQIARSEDRAEFYRFLLQVTGSHDYEPLKTMLEEVRTGAAKGKDGEEEAKSDRKRGAGSPSS